MKIAVVYNRDSKRVINLFGVPNREKYGLRSIKRISDALKTKGHTVRSFEGDKDLIRNLEGFMPQVLKGERPGMVFNLSYGIQGQARYTHVPSILEMVGMPYVGSGPLAHSLALDKVVAKMIFQQHGLPTPEFAVLEADDFEAPDLPYPMIVKPKGEAVSFGIKIVNDEAELREAAGAIFEAFNQPVLVERFIAGREINVGIIGNDPPEALPPVELTFGEGGPQIYTLEDKKRTSGREIGLICPAPVGDALLEQSRQLSLRAFRCLDLSDCARVDMRLDDDGKLYILEINSLPSLGEHGSYVEGASHAGLDFTALVNRLVEVASARYFGTVVPPPIPAKGDSSDARIFNFVTARRDKMQRRLRDWVRLSSRTSDPIGIHRAVHRFEEQLHDVGMHRMSRLTDERAVWCWQTPAGMDGGTLLIANVDVPLDPRAQEQAYREESEALYGEGIASSRAPLATIEFALAGLKAARLIKSRKIGVLVYGDEGLDHRYSGRIIRDAASHAKQVVVMRPGNAGGKVIVQRRGYRKFRLIAEGKPNRLGRTTKTPDLLRWVNGKLEAFSALSSKDRRIAIATTSVHTSAFGMLLPHSVNATIAMAYAEPEAAGEAEEKMRGLLAGDTQFDLQVMSDRPPMPQRKTNVKLARSLTAIGDHFDLGIGQETSVLPSAAGLVGESTPVVCGVGPVGYDLNTPHESIQRISLVQRALLLALFLAENGGGT